MVIFLTGHGPDLHKLLTWSCTYMSHNELTFSSPHIQPFQQHWWSPDIMSLKTIYIGIIYKSIKQKGYPSVIESDHLHHPMTVQQQSSIHIYIIILIFALHKLLVKPQKSVKRNNPNQFEMVPGTWRPCDYPIPQHLRWIFDALDHPSSSVGTEDNLKYWYLRWIIKHSA